MNPKSAVRAALCGTVPPFRAYRNARSDSPDSSARYRHPFSSRALRRRQRCLPPGSLIAVFDADLVGTGHEPVLDVHRARLLVSRADPMQAF